MIKCGAGRAIELLTMFVSSFTAHCRLLVTTFDNHQLVDGAAASPPAVVEQPIEMRSRTLGSQRPIVWLSFFESVNCYERLDEVSMYDVHLVLRMTLRRTLNIWSSLRPLSGALP